MKLPAFLRRWFLQPPADIVQAFNAVNSRMTYVYYKSQAYRMDDGTWVLRENRPKWVKENQGNCVAFVDEYEEALHVSREKFVQESRQNNIKVMKRAVYPTCLWVEWRQEWHCVLDVQDNGNTWRLDCRKRAVELV